MSELEPSESESDGDTSDDNEASSQSSPVRGKTKQMFSRRSAVAVSDSEDQSSDRKPQITSSKTKTTAERRNKAVRHRDSTAARQDSNSRSQVCGDISRLSCCCLLRN